MSELRSGSKIAVFSSTLSICAPFDTEECFVTDNSRAIWFTAYSLNGTALIISHPSLHLPLAGPTIKCSVKSQFPAIATPGCPSSKGLAAPASHYCFSLLPARWDSILLTKGCSDQRRNPLPSQVENSRFPFQPKPQTHQIVSCLLTFL